MRCMSVYVGAEVRMGKSECSCSNHPRAWAPESQFTIVDTARRIGVQGKPLQIHGCILLVPAQCMVRRGMLMMLDLAVLGFRESEVKRSIIWDELVI
jgi:hypothetical protein